MSSFFVDANGGSDTNSGSSSSPWATLQRAANAVTAGDIVRVAPGSYAGFDLRSDGTPTSRIVFSAEPGTVIVGRNPRTADGINLEGADYITVEGFRVENSSGSITRAGIRSVANTGAIIRNNVCDRNGTWGIFTGFSESVLIEKNTASRSGAEHGIYVSNSADAPIIRGNTIWGNRASGIHMNGDASVGGDGIISGALVANNTIYENGLGGGSAINCDGVRNSRIQNNLVYGNHASGISLYRIDGGGASIGNVVVNNTVLVASDGRWALNVQNGSTDIVAFNNILYNEGGYRGVVDISPDSLPGFISDYNAVMDRFTTDNGSSRLTLSQWRAATGQDQHSFVSTPAQLFADSASRDYRLAPGSPAIDTGASAVGGQLAPGNDISDLPRPQGVGYDVGAFEQQASPPFTIVNWRSSGVHSQGVGTASLVIPDDGSFSEGRSSGISWLQTTFSGAVDPVSVAPSAVSLAGNDVNNSPIDLSNIQVTTLVEGATVHIRFTPALPDIARYIVRLDGVRDAAARPLEGDRDRVLTALLGDVTGDRRVNNTDVGAAISLRGTEPIDPASTNHLRADVTNDGRINNTDVGGVISVRGRDARLITAPTIPVPSPANLVITPYGGSVRLTWDDRGSFDIALLLKGLTDSTHPDEL